MDRSDRNIVSNLVAATVWGTLLDHVAGIRLLSAVCAMSALIWEKCSKPLIPKIFNGRARKEKIQF
jgi:hypothetical protein